MKSKYINIHAHNYLADENSIVINNILMNKDPYFHQDESMFYSAGFHPWYIDNNSDTKLLADLINANKGIIALGEIGLDKKANTNYNLQEEIFESQLKIAKQFDLPVIIHSVKSLNNILQFRKEYPDNIWIYHSFIGNEKEIEQLIKHNIYPSFSLRSLNSKKTFNALRKSKLNFIFLETDDENILIEEIYNKVSEILEIDLAELKNIIYNNFKRVFK